MKKSYNTKAFHLLSAGLTVLILGLVVVLFSRAILAMRAPVLVSDAREFYEAASLEGAQGPLSEWNFLELTSWDFETRESGLFKTPVQYYDLAPISFAEHRGKWVVLVLGYMLDSDRDSRTAAYLSQLKRDLDGEAELWFARMNRRDAYTGLWTWMFESECPSGACMDRFLFGAMDSDLHYERARAWAAKNFEPIASDGEVDELPIVAIIDPEGMVRASWVTQEPLPEVAAGVVSFLKGQDVALFDDRTVAPTFLSYVAAFKPCLIVDACSTDEHRNMVQLHGSFRGETRF